MAQKSTNVGLSALMTSGLISFTRFSLLPCTLLYLYETKGGSWSYAVVMYGLLLSSFAFGQVVGQSMKNTCSPNNALVPLAYLFLPFSFALLCFVSRFTVMMLLFASIGLFGTLLSEVYFVVDRNNPKFLFHSQTDAELRSSHQRTIICFIFATLSTGLLYDLTPGNTFPLASFAIFALAVCFVIVAYYLFINKIASSKRMAAGIGSGSSSGSSSSDGASAASYSAVPQAPVADYTGAVPMPFINVCSGNIEKARKMFACMLQWRRNYGTDDIMDTYQPAFDDIAQYYPNKIHGYSVDGHCVVYEQLGQAKAKELLGSGATVDMMVRNQVLRNEFIFRRLTDSNVVMFKEDTPWPVQQQQQPKSDISKQKLHDAVPVEEVYNGTSKIISVLDVGGISMSSVTTDVISYLKLTSEILDLYYPERVSRLLIVNSPRWFFTIWNVIARALPESVQKKVDILSSLSALDKYIAPDQRPLEYGGTGGAIGESEAYQTFLKIPKSWKHREATIGGPAPRAPSSAVAAAAAAAGVSATAAGNSDATRDGDSKERQGWFRGKWFGAIKGGDSAKPAAVHAKLGYKNSYRFNQTTQMWELDPGLLKENEEDYEAEQQLQQQQQQDKKAGGSSSDMRSREGGSKQKNAKSRSGVLSDNGNNDDDDAADIDFYDNESDSDCSGTENRMKNTYRLSRGSTGSNSATGSRLHSHSALTPAQIEEHNVVLAIQAAHLASSFNKQETAAKAAAAAAAANSPSKRLAGDDSGAGGELHYSTPFSSATSAYGNKHSMEQLKKRQMEMMSVSPLGSNSGHGFNSGGGSGGGASSSGRERQRTNSDDSSSVAGSDICATSMVPKSVRNSLEKGTGGVKVSSPLFLLVVSLYLVTHIVQCSLFTLVPVWMATSRVDGGLGYGVTDIGIVMSAAGLMVLQIHSAFGVRIQSTIKASPVRILRAALATLLITLILVQFTLRIAAPLEDIQELLVATHGAPNGSKHSEQQRNINSLRGMDSSSSKSQAASADEMRIFHEAASYWFAESSSLSQHPLLPSQSPVQLILPASLFALLFCAMTICSKASSLLLHLSLKSSFSSPSTVRWALGAISDILGPVLTTLMYAGVLQHSLSAALKHYKSNGLASSMANANNGMVGMTPKLRYEYVTSHPHGSNATFFISFAAAGVVLVYMMTVFLRIQFRGDYGVISDSEGVSDHMQDAQVALSATGSLDLDSDAGAYSGRQYHQLFISNNRNGLRQLPSTDSSSSCCNQDALAIPKADISALWPLLWQGTAQMPVYGSKLYNLRDDYKDL